MISPEQMRGEFLARFGTPPAFASFAPGRVNLIGEHTDYNGGCVMPCAIHLGTTILARPARGSGARWVTLISATAKDEAESTEFVWPTDVPIEKIATRSPRWKNYLLAVVQEMRKQGIEAPVCDLLIVSDLPVGAGLSSSASLELATAMLILGSAQRSVNLREIALLCQRAEHSPWVGVRCGIMDQFASALGKAGNLILLDCSSLAFEYVRLDSSRVTLAILDSQVPRTLRESAYNARRLECEKALEMLRQFTQRPLPELCRVTRDELEAARNVLPTTLWRRANHVLQEHARVLEMASALRAQNWSQAGALLVASHASLRDLFEVSCSELDELVATAISVNGVYGARLTGAGFGGCVLALLEKSAKDELLRMVNKMYYEPRGLPSKVYFTVPSAGPSFRVL